MLQRLLALACFGLALIHGPLQAADDPAPREGRWVLKNFRFHSGEVLPELKQHYYTVG